MNIAQTIERLELAYAFLDTVPKHRINLRYVLDTRTEPPTGCAIGLLSQSPAFNALGLGFKAHWDGGGYVEYVELAQRLNNLSYVKIGMTLFGLTHEESDMLFAPAYTEFFLSDKTIWKLRCRLLIAKLKLKAWFHSRFKLAGEAVHS